MIFKILVLLSLLSVSFFLPQEDSDIFFNCHNSPEYDTFDLIIPSFCATNRTYSWYLEFKKPIYLHRNNQSCTTSLKILFVSKKYVMMPIKNNEKDDKVLLLDYLDSYHLDHPECVPEHKNYYRFNYDIYIDVEKNHYWNRHNGTNKNAIENSFLEMIDIIHKGELNREALILGIQSYLLEKSYSRSPSLFENDFIKDKSTGIFKWLKLKIPKKKKFDFTNVYRNFYRLTKLQLSNNENDLKIASKIIENKTNELGNIYYYELCHARNEKLKHFTDGTTPDEKVRKYLGRNDIIAKEIESKRYYMDYQWDGGATTSLPTEDIF
uniref:Uncharacterized protein n=1 Tax=Strongyloides papillosus TaxID=174720 RepID=A0A0N5BC00_STREA